MIQNEQYEQAVALIDFCGRDLTTENVAVYFKIHASFLVQQERNKVLLTALSLL